MQRKELIRIRDMSSTEEKGSNIDFLWLLSFAVSLGTRRARRGVHICLHVIILERKGKREKTGGSFFIGHGAVLPTVQDVGHCLSVR